MINYHLININFYYLIKININNQMIQQDKLISDLVKIQEIMLKLMILS